MECNLGPCPHHKVEQPFRTVRIRVKLMMDAQGHWAVYGWHGDTDDRNDVVRDMMSEYDLDTAREFYINADVPVPQTIEITGRVEDQP